MAGGGLKRDDDGVAEIKRMYVVPEARRQGSGGGLLEALEGMRARARLRADPARHRRAPAARAGDVRARRATTRSRTTTATRWRRSGGEDPARSARPAAALPATPERLGGGPLTAAGSLRDASMRSGESSAVGSYVAADRCSWGRWLARRLAPRPRRSRRADARGARARPSPSGRPGLERKWWWRSQPPCRGEPDEPSRRHPTVASCVRS